MGCAYSVSEEEADGSLMMKHHGQHQFVSNTSIGTYTKQHEDVPKSSSHFQSTFRDPPPSSLPKDRDLTSPLPDEKPRSNSISAPVVVSEAELAGFNNHYELSRNINLSKLRNGQPVVHYGGFMVTKSLPQRNSSFKQTKNANTGANTPISSHTPPSLDALDTLTTTRTEQASTTAPLPTPVQIHHHHHQQLPQSQSSFPSPSPTSQPQPTPQTNSPHRGSIRGILSRERDRSNSPTPTSHDHDANSVHNSPKRREMLHARYPPNLNLQSRNRFVARDIDATPEPNLKDISPRLSARLSQTAAIRRDMARQASLSQQQQAQAQQTHSGPNSAVPPSSATPPLPSSTIAPAVRTGSPVSQSPPQSGDWSMAVLLAGCDDGDLRSRCTVLNPRRAGGPDVCESPIASARCQISQGPWTSRNAKRSVSGFSQAIDLIDSTAVPEVPDFSPASRHSYRASRHSLGAPPPPPPTSVFTERERDGGISHRAGRRSTRGRGRGPKAALIVDNNTLSQRLTSVALHRAGFSCCDSANEGESAITLAGADHYELILIDSMLPSLSALETVKAIRLQEDQRGDVPTVIVALVNSLDPPGSPDQYKLARFNACLERGCILTEAIADIMESLTRNPNFLTLSANGTKTHESRTDAQEREDAELAIRRTFSQVPLAGEKRGLSPSLPEGAIKTRSNRRTTSTGRAFQIMAHRAESSLPAPAATTVSSAISAPVNPIALPIPISNLPPSSPSPSSDNFAPNDHLSSPLPVPHSCSHSPSPSPALPMSHSGSNPTAPIASPTTTIILKPRRASLSIHSVKDLPKS